MSSESDEQLQQQADAAFREYQFEDGGPAFPVEQSFEKGVGKHIPGTSGMSLLDYFAGQALAGDMSKTDNRTYKPDCGLSLDEWRAECLANDAAFVYQMAAAMLKERERIMAARAAR